MLPAMLAAVGTSLQTDEANARALLDSMIEIARYHIRVLFSKKLLLMEFMRNLTRNGPLEALFIYFLYLDF